MAAPPMALGEKEVTLFDPTAAPHLELVAPATSGVEITQAPLSMFHS